MNELSLNNRNWEEFKITNLFEIKGTTTSLKQLILKRDTDIDYPYITTKSSNMGVDGFYRFFTEEGNIIVFDSATDGNIHYEGYNFSASDHVEKLIPKFDMNFEIGQFIVACLRFSLKNKFHYGYKLSQTRMERQIVMLPVDSENKIDFDFMEKYIKNQVNERRDVFINYFTKNINKSYKSIPSLVEKNWDSFYLIDIFPNLNKRNEIRGKRLTEVNQTRGNTPYISSTSLNHGVKAFVGNEKEVRFFHDCLTLANSGSVGSTFYHPYEFIASDHVSQLKNPNFNKHVYLFIATLVKRLSHKYNFNREINNDRIKKECIILPITDDGKPDYEYMEQYMINLEINSLNKYSQYLSK